jgi:thioredoxin reductase
VHFVAIDTPARLAILGAGPIGLEAALYARFLGFEVVIHERGDVADAIRQWGHVRMFTPFGMNCSPLGLAAIQAQDEAYRPPGHEEFLTGSEWIERYLSPLADTDLLSEHLRLGTTVVAVGKEELLKSDLPGHEDRGDWSFRVLARDASGQERIDVFDGVLDCTGVFGQANWLGHGGMPAIGEQSLREKIEYRLPDILGRDRARYAGKHVLVVGAGMSAATNVVALVELAKTEPATRLTWITRREGAANAGGPIAVIESDRLPQRAELARRANQLSREGGEISYWPRNAVERIAQSSMSPGFEVELSGDHSGMIQVDEIIANVGFRPDNRLYEELHVQEPGASQEFKIAEPNFYILGSKSYGRRSDFLFQDGLGQIREVFSIIGDRPTLDLYAGATRLLR